VGLGLAALLASALQPGLLVLAGLSLALGVVLDSALLSFLAARGGVPFALVAAGLQLLHRAAGLVGLGVGLLSPRP
jgi:hypothetical protein